MGCIGYWGIFPYYIQCIILPVCLIETDTFACISEMRFVFRCRKQFYGYWFPVLLFDLIACKNYSIASGSYYFDFFLEYKSGLYKQTV